MVKKVRTITNQVNVWRICIDSYEGQIPQGRIYHMSLSSPVYFTGWMSFIKHLNNVLDTNDFPQESMQLRRFQNITETEVPKTYESEKLVHVTRKEIQGSIATFRIRILFRQNATWQGIVYWGDQGIEKHFRSMLELMILMDNCMVTGQCDDHSEAVNRSASII